MLHELLRVLKMPEVKGGKGLVLEAESNGITGMTVQLINSIEQKTFPVR